MTAGTVVTLTATPAAGSTFAGWSGACTAASGACVVTVDAAKSVTASFALIPYTLTIAAPGGGAGVITSNPPGINCGSDCSEAFPFGTVVTLTAVANTGSTFTGWSGAGCSGTGACVGTMDAAKSVTATFSATSTDQFLYLPLISR